MISENIHQTGLGNVVTEQSQICSSAPKWAALVSDRLFPMPRRHLVARAILEQAGEGTESVLVRDHEGSQDVVIEDEAMVDLASGNVFKTMARCESMELPHCSAAPKLAFVCEDAWEVTLIRLQTEGSLKRLLGLVPDARLLRDFESPSDQLIALGEHVRFEDGPVFRCAPGVTHGDGDNRELKIIVAGREKVVTVRQLSYAEVVRLAFPNADTNTIYTVTYKKGPSSNPEGSMVDGSVVNLQCGMIFNVSATTKS